MRILVDLLAVQRELDRAETRDIAFRWLRALVERASAHDIIVLASDRAPRSLAALREAFPRLAQDGKIATVCLSPLEVGLFAERAKFRVARAVTGMVAQGLEPDCVLTLLGRPAADLADIGAARDCAAVVLWPAGIARWPGAPLLDAFSAIDRIYVADDASAEELKRAGASAESLRVLGPAGLDDPGATLDRVIDDIEAIVTSKRANADAFRDSLHPRPRLAFVSPLPPEKTGVAAYNARLLPALADIYEIDLVTDQQEVSLPPGASSMPVRSVNWFAENFAQFDRVLYHVGNSPFHAHMPMLVRRRPGTVVMHDVFLGDLVNWLDVNAMPSGILQSVLIEGHGYAAARSLAAGVSRSEIVRRYECNCAVLDEADGVIAHSEFAAAIIGRRFGQYPNPPVARATLCRDPPPRVDREAARRRLGIPPGEFVVASFGFINHLKLHHLLIAAWLQTTCAKVAAGRLVIVGEGAGDPCHRALAAQILESQRSSQIAITGFVDDATMADHLSACDVAVQLRSETRGETSGAVLDCLAYGVPLIVNRCGWLAEIEDDAAIKLPFECNVEELRTALDALAGDDEQRQRLARAARHVVATRHRPHDVAQAYASAIERFARDGPRSQYARSLDALSSIVVEHGLEDADRQAIARAVAANLPRPGDRQLLIDVTPLVETDLRTGIERVSRAVVQTLIDSPPAGLRVEPIRFVDGRFVYARKFMARWIGLPTTEDDFEVEPRSGDCFLGLAWSPHAVVMAQDVLRRYRDIGVAVNFVVYDVLPQIKPQWFPPGLADQHRGWLVAAASCADRLVCISRSVAADVVDWLGTSGLARSEPLRIAHFPLGNDIESSVATLGVPEEGQRLLATLAARKVFMMVGTVEPRKGHRQTLAAFDILWRRGHDVVLVIAGKRGWMTEDVELAIGRHAELGRRLWRLEAVSDEYLQRLYGATDAVLIASEGEGFGLPIVEAARMGRQVIARDLAVFREVARDGAWYFSGESPVDLADSLEAWLASDVAGTLPDVGRVSVHDWAHSAAALVDVTRGRADFATWIAPAAESAAHDANGADCVIDFSDTQWPLYLSSMTGLSGAEVWGRWSNAEISPAVILEFVKALPRQGRLRVTARAFGPNCGRDAHIAIGGTRHTAQFHAADSTIEIEFATDGNQYTIVLTPPQPASPAESRQGDDHRRLGIGLVSLELRVAD